MCVTHIYLTKLFSGVQIHPRQLWHVTWEKKVSTGAIQGVMVMQMQAYVWTSI